MYNRSSATSMNSISVEYEIDDGTVHKDQLVAKDVGRISISKTNPIVRPGNVSTNSSTGDGVHVFDTQRTTMNHSILPSAGAEPKCHESCVFMHNALMLPN